MSKLPQPHNLKRKAADDLDGTANAKLPALASSSSQPFRPARLAKGYPPALTVPRAPLLQTTNVTTSRPGAKQRAVSAPPKSTGPAARGPQRVPVAATRPAPPSTKGGSSLEPVQEDGRWIEVQQQLHGMQAAQKNDRESCMCAISMLVLELTPAQCEPRWLQNAQNVSVVVRYGVARLTCEQARSSSGST